MFGEWGRHDGGGVVSGQVLKERMFCNIVQLKCMKESRKTHVVKYMYNIILSNSIQFIFSFVFSLFLFLFACRCRLYVKVNVFIPFAARI